MDDAVYKEYCLKADTLRTFMFNVRLDNILNLEFDKNGDEKFVVCTQVGNRQLYRTQDEKQMTAFLVGYHFGRKL